MPLVVQKFGGTSVGSLERIRHVAGIVKRSCASQPTIAVVSAMAGETNRLVGLSREVAREHHPEAYDMLLATGEQVSCALLAMALKDLGVTAIPMLGHQVGIRTDTLFTNARIERIDTSLLKTHLQKGIVPVVAGFQGVDQSGFITTLGRGGSDTSAVAIAVAMKADRCDIYTDVDGVYTADPRAVPKARKLSRITYGEMMELASLGAKVLHMRCVELAAKYKIPLQVLSTFEPDVPGTFLVEEQKMLESPLISAVTADTGQCLISLQLEKNNKSVEYPSRIFSPLAQAHINVDIIIETPPDSAGRSTVHFTVPRDSGTKALELLGDNRPTCVNESAVKISIVGIGMRTHSGVAAQIFDVLQSLSIPIHLVTTSEITVSLLIDEEHKTRALQGLHSAFGLDQP